jgi:hypothetical protein
VLILQAVCLTATAAGMCQLLNLTCNSAGSVPASIHGHQHMLLLLLLLLPAARSSPKGIMQSMHLH